MTTSQLWQLVRLNDLSRLTRFALFLAISVFVGAPVVAATNEQPKAENSPRLLLEPAEVTLKAADETVQLLVTRVQESGWRSDETRAAQLVSLAPQVVEVRSGVLVPRGNGEATVRATLAAAEGRPAMTAEMKVTVCEFEVDHPVSFDFDIEPLLSKYGCNAGGCHGKATGQNGFKLSLLGFDVPGDYNALVKEARGRRISLAAPDRSLLLLKSVGAVPHGGGARFKVDTPEYHLLRRWIVQGAPRGASADRQLAKLVVTPGTQSMHRLERQQVRVVAHYSDGAQRDVTAQAEYKSQQPGIVAVDEQGLVSTLDSTGEGTVMVRYMGLVTVARMTVPFGERVPASAYAHFKPKNFVDEFALRKWQMLGIAPSAVCTDQEFIRRACLDCIGTLPTPDEVRHFLADPNPHKRDALVDQLLSRNEYAAFWAQRWGDLLRNKRRYGDDYKRGTFAFAAWIRNALQQNMPYDQFVRQIVTAQGTVSDSPTVVWYREVRNIVHQVNDTSQLFLGTRINCANCHNHPYERWSQDDYWGMAAFFSRMGRKNGEVSNEQAIFVRKDGGMRQPRTNQEMKPRALGGPVYEYVRGEDPREKLVDWMVAKENPYFSPAMCNRMWAHFMGLGLVEAVDDMRVTNPPSNPELLTALSDDFIGHGFDVKHLIRTIMTSQVYGLSASPTEFNAKDKQNYARYTPKRMSAEVLLDAISAASGANEKFAGFPTGTRAIDLPDEAVGSYFLDVFGRSHRDTPCECERSYAPNLAQVLHLMNSPELQNKLADGRGLIAQGVAAKKTDQELIETMYLASVSRLPQADELKDAATYVAGAKNRQAALTDMLWVLLNSKEFLFNH